MRSQNALSTATLWLAISLPIIVNAQAEGVAHPGVTNTAEATQIVPHAGAPDTEPAVQITPVQPAPESPTETFNNGLYTPDALTSAAVVFPTISAIPAVTSIAATEDELTATSTSTTELPTSSSTTESSRTSTSSSSISRSSRSTTSQSSSSSTSVARESASASASAASAASSVGTPFKVILPLIIIGSIILLCTIIGFIWHRRRKSKRAKEQAGFHRKTRSLMPPDWDEDDEKSSFTGLQGEKPIRQDWAYAGAGEDAVDQAFQNAYHDQDRYASVGSRNMAGFGVTSVSANELRDERGWAWGSNRSNNHKQASVIGKGSTASRFRAKKNMAAIPRDESIPDLDALLAESRTGYTTQEAAQLESDNRPGMLARTASMVYSSFGSRFSGYGRRSHTRLQDDNDGEFDEYGQKRDPRDDDAASIIDLRYEGNGYSHVRNQSEYADTPPRPLPLPPSTPRSAANFPRAPESAQKMDSQISRSVKRWTLADDPQASSPVAQFSRPPVPPIQYSQPHPSLTPGRNALNTSVGPLSPPLQPHFFYSGSSNVSPTKSSSQVYQPQESGPLSLTSAFSSNGNTSSSTGIDDPFGPSYTALPNRRERRQSITQDNSSPVRRSAVKMVSSLSQPAHSSPSSVYSNRSRANSIIGGGVRTPGQRQRDEDQAHRDVSMILKNGRSGTPSAGGGSKEGTPVKERIRMLREQQSKDSMLSRRSTESLQHSNVMNAMTSPTS